MAQSFLFQVHVCSMISGPTNQVVNNCAQYDTHASVVSWASGWHRNRLDFYSSVASQTLASVQPIRLLKKFHVRDAIWLVKKIHFPMTLWAPASFIVNPAWLNMNFTQCIIPCSFFDIIVIKTCTYVLMPQLCLVPKFIFYMHSAIQNQTMLATLLLVFTVLSECWDTTM